MAAPRPVSLSARRTGPSDAPTIGQALAEMTDVLAVHTLDEAASILRVRRSWLERQAAARKIPFTMLGGAYHFTASHLLTIVRIHEVAPLPCEQDEAVSRARPARQLTRPQSVAPLRPRPLTGPRRAA